MSSSTSTNRRPSSADALLATPKLVEEQRVFLGKQHGALVSVAVERRPKGLLPSDLSRRDVGRVSVVGRHLHRELAARPETGKEF